jgi:hypothetical protein
MSGNGTPHATRRAAAQSAPQDDDCSDRGSLPVTSHGEKIGKPIRRDTINQRIAESGFRQSSWGDALDKLHFEDQDNGRSPCRSGVPAGIVKGR